MLDVRLAIITFCIAIATQCTSFIETAFIPIKGVAVVHVIVTQIQPMGHITFTKTYAWRAMAVFGAFSKPIGSVACTEACVGLPTFCVCEKVVVPYGVFMRRINVPLPS